MQIETSFASQLYAAARRLGQEAGPAQPARETPGTGTETAPSFAEALAAVAGDFAETLRAGETAARDAMAGRGDVLSLVEALTAAELALQSAVAVRDRVVEAYQEILRMPI